VASAFFAVECAAGVVHSFEPIGPIFAYLKENLRHFAACVPHQYGLSSTAGPADITYYPDICEISGMHADPIRDHSTLRRILIKQGGTASQVDEGLRGRFSSETLTCEFRTVSDVLRSESLGRVDLLKLDVEGAELAVLEGIKESDWPLIRQLAGELHLAQAERDRFLSILRKRGFQIGLEQEPAMRGTPYHLFWARRARDPRVQDRPS
jgi:FkbM family methyltransferase